jgi:hypothetical protein
MATLKQNSEALKAITNKLKNLPKRVVLTDLVVTKNGEYASEDENSGFKRVSVNVPSEMDAMLENTLTEVNSGVMSIGEYALYNRNSLTSANFPNATNIGKSAFEHCKALTSANIPNATIIAERAFYYCLKLKSVDFPKVTSISNDAFYTCDVLKSVDFPNVTSIGSNAFYYCRGLTSASLPNITSIPYAAFYNCPNLKATEFPKVTRIGRMAFYNGVYLPSVNFTNLTEIDANAFSACSTLKAVILRSETMCALSNVNAFDGCYHILGTKSNTYNPNGDKDGYFYVPRALLSDDDATKDYRRATNWSTYASQFRALEDYTVDGTITGELDPNKI